MLGAFVLLFYAGRADRQDQVSFGLWRGSLLAWLGFGLLLRKGSIIVVFAGSFLAALVLMMVGLSLGNLSR